MADNQKYYYLKLKEDFFEREEIVILESMKDGVFYSNILMKMFLKSLKSNGRLMFNDRIPYDANMLSTITRQPVAVVEKAVSIFRELDLVEVLDNGAIYMLDIQNFIGESSSEGDRKRKYRQRIAKEKLLLQGGQMSDERPPEIEIEREKERERERERERDSVQDTEAYIWPSWLTEESIEVIKKGNPSNYDYRVPIAYLNQVISKSFKFVDKNIIPIKARFREGYTIDDFKHVVDVKVEEWGNNPEMAKYLRPTTLFGTKFDDYRNQEMKKNITTNNFNDPNAAKFAGMEDWANEID